MNEINKAKRLRMAAVDEGEGVKIRAIKEAEAEVDEQHTLQPSPAPLSQAATSSRRHTPCIQGSREGWQCVRRRQSSREAPAGPLAQPPFPCRLLTLSLSHGCQASRTEIQAKADAEAKFMAGQGIARQRQAIISGLRESVNSFKAEVAGVDAKQARTASAIIRHTGGGGGEGRPQ